MADAATAEPSILQTGPKTSTVPSGLQRTRVILRTWSVSRSARPAHWVILAITVFPAVTAPPWVAAAGIGRMHVL